MLLENIYCFSQKKTGMIMKVENLYKFLCKCFSVKLENMKKVHTQKAYPPKITLS